jgi:hypothetical protein
MNEDMQWKLMLDHFKENPADLLDAFPTPEGSEEGENELKGFKTGLTPKKNFKYNFGSKTDGLMSKSFNSRTGPKLNNNSSIHRPGSSFGKSPMRDSLKGLSNNQALTPYKKSSNRLNSAHHMSASRSLNRCGSNISLNSSMSSARKQYGKSVDRRPTSPWGAGSVKMGNSFKAPNRVTQ